MYILEMNGAQFLYQLHHIMNYQNYKAEILQLVNSIIYHIINIKK